ncbi:uncharacterized protein LOC104887737 [Beta vulgaris subsp. vulgaris]|uniref:uncharacterized protein LOC104887737 n=1 Tax=Beta vulgaris subsp. vulgaris TaxID=3555 RepID=UPI002037375B|nr:uncharacterized protein LOC104887737 [Beta vulgaris subsp. vulgaris]XP_010670764.2 uncharacterized protein LOC104887737 [Beta vulgaris subsp. vulgaris]
MSNTLISGQLALPTLPDSQMSHLNSIRSRADSSVPGTSEGAVDPLNSNLTSTSGNLCKQSESMQPHSGQLELSMPNKRKATTDPVPDNWGLEKMTSNKRVAPVGSNPKVPILSSVPNKRTTLNTSTRSTAYGKKVVQLDSPVNKSPSAFSKKNAQPEVSPRNAESYDSVRTKLRESLASALALVSQQREGSSDGKVKSENEVEANTQEGIKEHKPLVCESTAGTNNIEPVKVEEFGTSSILIDGSNDDTKESPGTHPKETCSEDTQTWKFIGSEFQSNPILSGEDSLFGDGLFFKDELLQGNGLSWVSDPNPHISELHEVENTVKSEVEHEDVTIDEEKIVQSPESLALEIESELFTLFGGVNKKYKEKGRSLLFNLKDRNNPELRERVMSGEIPPDRLCSMTAEELASKELSEWRIAKAEELDHMKVLPESDVNMRRLVKKTHKGEYQVDLEPDMGASEDLSPTISVPSQKRSKINGSNARPLPKAEPTKVEQYDQCEITIPSDGTDMQGLMVDDVNDLPPIVSLDEFMESLNNEPPFENLPVDSETTALEADKENPEVGSKSRSPVQSLKQPVKLTSQKTEELGVGSIITETDKKLADSQKGLNTTTVHIPKQEHIWEGLLQLSISSMANFVALYKSGEKASTKEWAGYFDIKGRVRLDAFDKFLQALPMSRSRAIMVSHFVLKEGTADSERSDLLELVDSYIADERCGFAEPAPGVELYLCPPRTKTVDMIINHLPKSYTEKLNNIDDGLIGIVVWRKVQITPPVISPNSLSHQKHTNKTHTGSQNTVNDDMNRNNVGFAPRTGPSPPILSKPPQPDEDDDVPPGFGPPAGHRDDDDLPEFNFSGGSGPNVPTSVSNSNPKLNPVPGQGMGSRHHNLHRAPTRQVDQMRELIQKYGQNGANRAGGIPIEPWNDDDDDIPEWQPQGSHPGPPPPPPPVHQQVQNPAMAPHMVHHPSFQRPPWPPIAQPIQPLQPPMSVQQQGTWWPYGANNVGNLPSGQFNGAPGSGHMARDWRTNNSGNNKGF